MILGGYDEVCCRLLSTSSMIVVDESQIGGQDVAEKIMAGGDLAKKKLCVAGTIIFRAQLPRRSLLVNNYSSILSTTMESFPTNLLPSLTDAAVTVPPEQATIGASPTEQFYVAHNRSVLALAVLCVGLRDGDGNLMFDPSEKPWKSMKKKTVNPSTKDMRDEVQRRWDAFVVQSLLDKDKEKGPPATKYWDKKQLEKWLGDHPINGIEDVSFVCRVIAERKETSENAKKYDEWESEQLNATTHAAATDAQGKK